MQIDNFDQAIKFIRQRLPANFAKAYENEAGLRRMKYFLNLLGNPQEKIRIVHIVGTSGKGSTAYFVSNLLTSLGYKTGLQISPHIINEREQISIDRKMISEKQFCEYLNYFQPMLASTDKQKLGRLTNFEIITAMAMYHFYKNKVDYAVIEAGVGGLNDATNCISNANKLNLITKIGRDHMNLLGNTLQKIATHKAMIMQKGNMTISTNQKLAVKDTIMRVAKEKECKVIFINQRNNYSRIKCAETYTEFDFKFENQNFLKLRINATGEFQAENCCLALSAIAFLSKHDQFNIDEVKIRNYLAKIHIPGRLEIINLLNKKIILDGAHNSQKMKALITSLKKIFPNKKFDFLLAIRSKKEHLKIIKHIVQIANKIWLTDLPDAKKRKTRIFVEPKKLENLFHKLDFSQTKIIEELSEALRKALKGKEILVITGSLYLLGQIHSHLKNYKL
ncbi:MAG: Mur ligase family protein [Patescibacteria group bacterium]|nr:Mur ligase family protein [Patescibacteria group bacterium]